MPEFGFDQGSGLRRLAARSGVRLLALVSQDERASELALLWGLCASWSRQGYSVAVLDAACAETDERPGLRQWLAGEHEDLSGGTWTILPAARGLRRLSGRVPGSRWAADHFGQFDLVLLYAGIDELARVLPDSGVHPLMTLSPCASSTLVAYQGVKRLLLDARLRPTIATIVDEADPSSSAVGRIVSQRLQDCTHNFLGCRLAALSVRVGAGRAPTPEVEQLALRLLEEAPAVERAPILPAGSMARRGFAPSVGGR